MAEQQMRIRFSAVDDASSVIGQITGSITVMVAKMEGISQRLEAIGNAMGADFDGLSSSSELLDSAIQEVTAATERLGETQSSASREVAAIREELEQKARAAYEAAGADQDVIDAAVELADANAELTGAMVEAQMVQDELTSALDEAARVSQRLTDCDEISAEVKERLAESTSQATAAQERLEAAQAEAAAAQEYANQLIESGAASMEEIQAAIQRVQAAQDELADATREASDATNDLEDATRGAEDELENLDHTLPEVANNVQNLLEAFGLAVGLKEFTDYLSQCVEKSAEFGEALAKVSTIADTSRASMDELRAGLMDISNETGDSVLGLTDAMYQAISASVDTANAVEFTATAAKLASGGFTEQATAVDILTTALNAYGLEASDATRISDMLITTQNLGKTQVGELAATMGRVIPTAAAYGVEMDNLSTAYAELTKGGIGTAEATTYLSGMFNELGSESSTVSAILKEQTGQSFAELMTSGESLGNVLQVLGDSVDGNATAFANLWGSQTAGVGALALYNSGAEQFNATLGEMQNSAGATADAFNTMENTTADALGDMQNAFDNLGIAIGDAMTPLAEFGAGILTTIVEQITAFATTCPEATAAILAAAAAVGVAAVAFKALGDAINISFPVLAAISAAIAGVTALVISLTSSVDEEAEAYRNATPEAREYADALYEAEDALADMEEAGYNAVDATEAQKEAYTEQAAAVEAARTEYELMYESMDDLIAKNDAIKSSISDMCASVDEQMSALQQAPATAQIYISKLSELGSRSRLTTGEMRMMEGLVSELNSMYPELGLSVEDFTNSTEESVDAIESQIEALQKSAEIEAYQEMYSEAAKQLAEANVRLAETQPQLEAAREEYEKLYDEFGGGARATQDAYERMTQLEQAIGDTEAAAAQAEGKMNSIADAMGDAADVAEELADATEDAWEAMNPNAQGMTAAAAVFKELEGDIQAVIDQYNAAYDTAKSSLEGQKDMFNEFKLASDVSVDSVIKNLNSFSDATMNYTNNLSNFRQYLDESTYLTTERKDAIMANLNEMTPETAAIMSQVDALIQQAAAGVPGAQAKLEELIGSMSRAEGSVEMGSQGIAESVSGSKEKIAELEDFANSLIDGLDLSAEAAAVAKTTMSGYIDGINAQGGPMKQAAFSHASAASDAILTEFSDAASGVSTYVSQMVRSIEELPTSKTFTYTLKTVGSVSAPNVPGNARGTRFSLDDIYIAGEEGPELIVGGYGSRVYTAPETSDILDALRDAQGRRMTDTDPLGDVKRGFEWNADESPLGHMDQAIARMMQPFSDIGNASSARPEIDYRDELEEISRAVSEREQPDYRIILANIHRTLRESKQPDDREELADISDAIRNQEPPAFIMDPTGHVNYMPQLDAASELLEQIQSDVTRIPESLPDTQASTLSESSKDNLSSNLIAELDEIADRLDKAPNELWPEIDLGAMLEPDQEQLETLEREIMRMSDAFADVLDARQTHIMDAVGNIVGVGDYNISDEILDQVLREMADTVRDSVFSTNPYVGEIDYATEIERLIADLEEAAKPEPLDLNELVEAGDRIMLPTGALAELNRDEEPRFKIDEPLIPLEPKEPSPNSGPSAESTQTQKLEITLNGGAPIRIQKGANKDAVVAEVMRLVESKLPGALMDMLQEESLQEGDRSYAL